MNTQNTTGSGAPSKALYAPAGQSTTNGAKISEEEIRKELMASVKETVKTIMKYHKSKKWEDFLNDVAIDCTVEKYVNKNPYELSGFSVLLAYGGPFIEWVLHRGVSYVYATWGGVELKENIDIDAAYEFLDFLESVEVKES